MMAFGSEPRILRLEGTLAASQEVPRDAGTVHPV